MAQIIPTSFDAGEQEVLRFLAGRFHEGNPSCKIPDIPVPEGFDEQQMSSTIHRLNNYGIVDRRTNIHVNIQPGIVKVIEKLDNPDTPNYWSKAIEWWFSKRWRAAVTIFVVLLPLVVQWIEMVGTVLRCLGVSAG